MKYNFPNLSGFDREYLSDADFEEASDLFDAGLDISEVYRLLRGWAQDKRYEINAETCAASKFESDSY